jgi:hypothetical protein
MVGVGVGETTTRMHHERGRLWRRWAGTLCVLLLFGTPLLCEHLIYYVTIAQCSWPLLHTPVGAQCSLCVICGSLRCGVLGVLRRNLFGVSVFGWVCGCGCVLSLPYTVGICGCGSVFGSVPLHLCITRLHVWLHLWPLIRLTCSCMLPLVGVGAGAGMSWQSQLGSELIHTETARVMVFADTHLIGDRYVPPGLSTPHLLHTIHSV